MKRNIILIAALLVSFAVLMPTSASGCRRVPPCCEEVPPISIEKEAYCMKPSSGPLDTFSNNPPYHMGTKYYWWIEINVTAKTDLTSYRVVVYDRLGAEFMIEGICVDSPKQPDLPGYPNMGGNPKPFDYNFTYSGGEYLEPERHDEVIIRSSDGDQVESGWVDWRGVMFDAEVAGDTDTLSVFWTGKSCKAHFKWTIGPMEENESKIIYLVISTDINPGGHQEFTSPCTHYLNSGATVKVLIQRTYRRCWYHWIPFYSATTDPLTIKVEEN
ncbi:MAG: hypothetical protein OEX00_12325 [Gammaproteobacteria bacterium]|nr:hypothetical protein [Gammaproteobacteria bacterium]